MTLDEQLTLIQRGTVETFTPDDLKKKLAKAKPLRVKLGVDPTSPDIHLGHTVVLRKLRQFQDLGHQAVLIIGDFTARIGDPSGKKSTRPQLTGEEIDANAKTYLDQIGKVVDRPKLELVRNGDWLGKLTFQDIIGLAAKFTVARILEREDFTKRYKEGTPIGLHEFLYPLMQAYDSVVVKA
ncbi:MAG: tyrosine--tRNA ligase, partial [Planctomycetota bacterium]